MAAGTPGAPSREPQNATDRVSVIIVTYESHAIVGRAVASAVSSAARAGIDCEVIVVDNASSDGSADEVSARFPAATVIMNGDNRGFGRACNQAFEFASGDWWLLLNPDAVLQPNALGTLVGAIAERPRAAAVAPTLTGAGFDRAESAGMLPGLRSAAGHFLFLNRLIPGDKGGPWRGFQIRRRPGAAPRRVDWAGAAALLLRPAALREVGGFDESLFLYGEDVDLGRRLRDRGWEIWLIPRASATHGIAASSGGVTGRWLVALHDDVACHQSRPVVVAFDLICSVGLVARWLIALLRAGRAPLTDGQRTHIARMRVASRTAVRLAFGRRP